MSPDPSLLIAPGEGENPFDAEFTLKTGREEIVLSEANHTGGVGEPPPHVHHEHADCFYVLEGELRFLTGDAETLVGPGGIVVAPPTSRTPTGASRPQRFVNIHAPGIGFDHRIRQIARDFDQHDPPPDGGRRRLTASSCRRARASASARPRRAGPRQGRRGRRARLADRGRVGARRRSPGRPVTRTRV